MQVLAAGGDLAQLTASGLFHGASYGALGAGFALILGVTTRFHFAYSLTYTFTAYAAYSLTAEAGLPFWPAALLGVLAGTVLGVLLELLVYRRVAARSGGDGMMPVFVASLGVGVAGIALLQLVWGSQSQPYYGPSIEPLRAFGASFVNLDVYQAATSVVLVLGLAAALRYTGLGRAVRATRGNPGLAAAQGIDVRTVYLVCFAAGSFIAGVCALWYGLQYTVDPAMGTRPGIYAIVVAFLAGTSASPLRVLLVGLGVGLAEAWSGLWLSLQWTQTTVFVLLVGYLVIRAAGPLLPRRLVGKGA
ncbi:branched-chain amino acid ABC transporter permease [Actinocorallia sp. A-T 12471]|uniref:branched-chain amino acid ABC transporter permease n=1 Tax=Actinocorallia sp. A-T 12471 TaxID=3089813 RepID=UPI0029CEB3B4|nr:branched-chain amino acid ABC transporter permease [Actinocorallia sp. A-T 12471]MDX6739650.1 branched-chain amino acid ABC transporter permease [Actinocorallia sp. A-T 12471]